MACRRKLNTSSIYALIRMIVTTFNPKQSLRPIRTKGTFKLNSFTEREKVHVTMSRLLVVSDKKPLHFLITMDTLKLFLFLSLFVCFVYF